MTTAPAAAPSRRVSMLAYRDSPTALPPPNKLFEYMMMGLPVVAGNYPGLRPLVEGEDVGLCVDPGSPSEIAAALNRLAADPARRERIQRNGLRLSKDRYMWELESAPLLQRSGSLAPMPAPLRPDGAPVE